MPTEIMTPRAVAFQRLRRETHHRVSKSAIAPKRLYKSEIRSDSTDMLHESAVFTGMSGDRIVMSLMTHPRFRQGEGYLQATIVADPRRGKLSIQGADIFKAELLINGHKSNVVFAPMIEGVSTLISANLSADDTIAHADGNPLKVELLLQTRNAELGRLQLVQVIASA